MLSAWAPGANGGGVALPPTPALPCGSALEVSATSVAPTAAAAMRGNSSLQLAKSLSCSSFKVTGQALAVSSFVGMIKCPSEFKERLFMGFCNKALTNLRVLSGRDPGPRAG